MKTQRKPIVERLKCAIERQVKNMKPILQNITDEHNDICGQRIYERFSPGVGDNRHSHSQHSSDAYAECYGYLQCGLLWIHTSIVYGKEEIIINTF